MSTPEEIRAERTLPDGGGILIKSTPTTHVLVVPMLVNNRICTVPVGADLDGGMYSYDRYWCYPKGPAAVLAARAWDGSEDTEPVGWIKSWDQRYTNPGINMKGVDGVVNDGR